MSRRKLKIVEYDRDYVNVEDDADVRRFIATMEEMHIGMRDENWSAKIIDEPEMSKWKEEMENYVKDLGAPEGCSKAAAIDFVLISAINNIYRKNEAAQSLSFGEVKKRAAEILEAHKDSQNPLNRIDYDSSEFAEHARTLCSLLGIANNHQDAKVLMKSACLYIIENLKNGVLEEENDAKWKKPKMLDIKEFPLGIALAKQGAVNYSARVLRLITHKQLKDVQTKINETLVKIQNLTIDMSKQSNMKQIKYGNKTNWK